MFDHYTVRGKEYIPYEKSVSVVEKRAPTDDSIRLYAEIKEKAYSSVLSTIELQDNILNLSAIVYEEVNSMHKVCKYRLTLNGKEILGEKRIDALDIKTKDIREVYSEIVNDISQYIAVEILKEVEEDIR